MIYRKEIDGLRAISVLPVIFFHAGFTIVSGGFIGVDVFFVISGYLITSILLQEIQDGKYSIKRFYERRLRRILPALFFVMLTCLPFAWFWLLPHDLQEFSKSLGSVSIFGSNIFFNRQISYFNSAVDIKPLLHTWSLGIEEQYYLIFPLYLLLIWRHGRRWLFGVTICLIIISLLYASYMSSVNASDNFYLLPSRIWELLIGSLLGGWLFFYNKTISFPERFGEILSSVGLLFICISVITFDKNTPNPSVYTLLPVIGASLIILFANCRNVVGRFLGNRVLVEIGLISYSVYLWHQPLLAFIRIESLQEPTKVTLFMVSMISILMGYLTWKFVENPFRDPKKFSQNTIFVLSTAGIVVFVTMALIGDKFEGFPQRFSIPTSIKDEFEDRQEICIKRDGYCVVGDITDAAPELAVFGDSHAASLMPAFDAIGKKMKKAIIFIVDGGCPPLLGIDVISGDNRIGACQKVAQQQLKFVKNNKINKIFLAARWSLYTDGDYDGRGMYYLGLRREDRIDNSTSRQAFEYGLKNTVENYKKLKAKIYVVSQVPQQLFNTREIYYKMYDKKNKGSEADFNFIKKYAVPVADHISLQSFNRKVFASYLNTGDVEIINLDSIFCNEINCSFGTASKPYYRDIDHLSFTGAMLTIPLLEKSLVSEAIPHKGEF